MRIKELLEGKHFNDLDFVKKNPTGNEIDFDLVEDLTFFMNNDDETYRRHVYPSIAKCIAQSKGNKKIDPNIFKNAALEGYKKYVTEFPIRELPDTLDRKMCEKVCEKLHDNFRKHFSDGKYKD
jgi:oligoendopeptidase F